MHSSCAYVVLQPYKYSGYPMLIKTIQMEIEDPKAFSKEAALLPSACELCYHTVNTSALNAEELRRENGIEVSDKILAVILSVFCVSYSSLCWRHLNGNLYDFTKLSIFLMSFLKLVWNVGMDKEFRFKYNKPKILVKFFVNNYWKLAFAHFL